jgi:hypothetical protein
MNRYKWILVALLALTLGKEKLLGQQVSIILPGNTGPVMRQEMFWNISVVNADRLPFTGRIQIVVNDENGFSVLQALSSAILFSSGTKVLSKKTVEPVNYLYSDAGNSSGWMKAGKYRLCYTVIKETKEDVPVAEECTDLLIEPLSPPLLSQPSDKSEIYEDHPAFAWIPPAPVQIFNSLKYEIKIVEIKKDQVAADALENNTPVYFENNLPSPFRVLPYSATALKENTEYAWQVLAYDNGYNIKSEAWIFKVVKDSVMQIIESSPFIAMKQNDPQFGLMHQGFLKVLLNNYSTDTIANFRIYEEGKDKQAAQVEVKITQGENYVLQEIDRRIKLDEDKLYQLVWVNSRGEKWMVRYQPKYYRK